MADTIHRDALQDDGFHEIQLSGKQLVALFMGGTTIAVLIFLCGVQVGRNVKGGSLVAADTTDTMASATATPSAAAAAPTEAAPSSGPPAAEPPSPPQDDELSYAKRLQASDPAAGDKLSAKADEPKAAPRAAPEPKPVETKSAPPPAPALAAKPAPAEPVGASKPGAWIVQLTALQDRSAAANIARQLAGKGYPAFVVDPAPGAPVIYRVQVGGYADHDKADQAARRLEKDEHYKPYVRAR
jgi:cell division septation protein DedD